MALHAFLCVFAIVFASVAADDSVKLGEDCMHYGNLDHLQWFYQKFVSSLPRTYAHSSAARS